MVGMSEPPEGVCRADPDVVGCGDLALEGADLNQGDLATQRIVADKSTQIGPESKVSEEPDVPSETSTGPPERLKLSTPTLPSNGPKPEPIEPPPKAKKTRKHGPPADLTLEQRVRVNDWAIKKEPWALGRLEELVEDCLMHGQRKAETSTDWVLNVMAWIRNERKFHGTGERHSKGTGANSLTEAHAELTREIEAAEELEHF